jgi:serine/threonine-protein kinase
MHEIPVSGQSGAGAPPARRVALYALVMSCVWGITWVIDFALGFVFDRVWYTGNILSNALHLGVAVVLWISALALRRLAIVDRFSGVADAVVTLSQLAGIAVILTQSPARYLPHLEILLGLTNILAIRAALVPSSATRTAILGGVGAVAVLVATWLIHSRSPGAAQPLPMVMAGAAIWCNVTLITSTLVSRVIFGLRREVREAKRLGQYTLEEKIGEGGMGVVYRARHALLRRPTAIKLLPPERSGGIALDRFEREVQATSALTHPNTIAIYDYGHTPDGVFYYAMEFLKGLDLDELVKEHGPQAPGRVVRVLTQAAGALAEAHEAGLMHRDVKPANILLCHRGLDRDFVKVVDFGLVREIRTEDDPGLTGPGAIAGTPLYMPPEAISGGVLDARSDLYALGAVGYYLVTGTPPFEGKTIVEVCAHHLHTPPTPPHERLGSAVPSELEATLLACLAKEPRERPASARDLIERLQSMDVEPWTGHEADAWWKGVHDPRKRATERPAAPRPLTVDLTMRA